MYDTILVPVDGTAEGEKGAEHAVELAADLDATLHGLFVIEEGGNPWLSESMDDQMDEARAYAQKILDGVGDDAAAAGVTYETEVKVGPKVHEKILEYAEESGADLIVMGSGYHGQIGGLLGSVTDKVLRVAEVPVMMVRRIHEA